MKLSATIVTRVLALCGASVPALAHAGGALFAEDPGALENACGGADGCWTNYLRVTDLDGDDDLDVVTVNYEGFFAAGQPEPLAVYTNDGAGVFANTSAASVGGFSGRIRQVAIGDVDGDGDPDMYVPDANGGADNLFLNEGGVFTPMEADLGSNAGAARFGDLDDDGDLDLFLADGYNATDTVHGHVYLNDGDGGFAELDGAIPAPAGSDPDDVDFLDADGDFDLDIMLNNHSGTNELWLNEGDGTFVDATSGLPSFPGGFHYGPAMCDVDGDGDLDAWVDNMGPDYSEMLLINDGAGAFTDETAARVSGNGNNDDNGLVCLDIDYDGDLDAIVISLFTAERYLENDGAGNFGSVSGVFAQQGLSELWGELGDVNGDGRLDLVTGAGESGTVDRVFLGTAAQTADATPPAFRAVQTDAAAEPDTDFVVHFGVVDNAVTDEGPRLHAAFARVDAGDGPQEIPASFMGGDLFRVVVPGQPDGTTVNVTVCATDRQDNEGCAEPFDVDVGAAGTGGTTAGTDDSGGTDPTDDTADSGADTTMGDDDDDASATDPDDDDDSASEDDSSGSGPPSDGDDGCNCTQSTSARPTAGLALLVAFGLRRRRRVRSS